MTALPGPGRLLTIGDYARLGGDHQHRWELQEGALVISPGPGPVHVRASGRLLVMLEPQVPAGWELMLDIDVDLRLAGPDQPGSVRRPDLVVVTEHEVERVVREGGFLRADQVSLAIEIVSPGSGRMDRLVKRAEYADAGIPHYWIVELDAPVSLVACQLAGEFGYQDGGSVTGRVSLEEPFPAELDLTRLIKGPGSRQ
jgi:Uma2 family endonuclease